MKKSEFLNKTKEELLDAWNEIIALENDTELDEETEACFQFIEMLLNNEVLLKAMVNTKDDRKVLLTLAESVKAISKVFKNAMQEEDVDDFKVVLDIAKEVKKATKVANKRWRKVERHLEDDMGDYQPTEEEVMDAIFDNAGEKLGLDNAEVEALKKILDENENLDDLLK